MKKNLKRIITLILFVNVIGLSVYIVSENMNKSTLKVAYYLNGLPVYNSHAAYAYDVSSPEKAYAASRYVFIAKINGFNRTEYENIEIIEKGLFSSKRVSDPITIYNISVIQNIKGNLITRKEIELKQYGGINEDKKSYTFVENGHFLEEGSYYLFLTGTDVNGGIIEVTNPDRIIYLGKDIKLIKEIQSGKILTNNSLSKDEIDKYKKLHSYFNIKLANKLDNTDLKNSPILNNVSKYDICYNNSNCDNNSY